MKIENEIFQFHPQCQFEKLSLSELQLQYLADLRGQNSIYMLVENYLKNGWLVNFQLLFDLIAMLAQHNWILNPVIKDYFLRLQPAQAPSASSSAMVIKPQKSSELFSIDKFLQLPFFRSLQPELARYLLSLGRIDHYLAQATICEAGDSSRDLYVLLKGEAGVYKQATTFKQFISILSESSVFGEMGFLMGEKRAADIVALKACDVLVIPYQAEILDRYLNKEKAETLQQRFWVQHALLHSDFFKNTPPDSLDALTFVGKIIDLKDQQILFNQADLGHAAYIVVQGSLDIFENGKKINTMTQGAFLGEISLLMNAGHRTATAMAQRNTKVLEISRAEFYRLLAKNLYLAKEFQILASQRLQRSASRAAP